MASRKMLIAGETDPANEENAHTDFDYDLFVIGAGSGGVRAARFSANFGAKVGICELPFHPISSEVVGGVGGTCVIRGCVPKKILVYGAVFGGELQDAKSYGWELNEKIDFNWKNLLHKKTEEILRLNSIYKRLLSSAGVKLLEGEGKVVGPHEVQDGQFNRENFNAGRSVRSFPGAIPSIMAHLKEQLRIWSIMHLLVVCIYATIWMEEDPLHPTQCYSQSTCS